MNRLLLIHIVFYVIYQKLIKVIKFRQTHINRYEPYLEGESCSMCRNNCDKGLCDCKGIYCHNGGKLDLSTCR